MTRRRQHEPLGKTIDIGLRAAALAVVLIAVAVGAAFVVIRGNLPTTESSTAPIAAPDPPALGAAEAPVTIVEFADYQCPNCRQFAEEVLPWLRETWMARGLVRLEYRDFAIRGDASYRAAEAAHCAGEQERYWKYHDLLYADPGQGEPFSRPHLVELATLAGLQTDSFVECLDSGRHRPLVEASTQYALDEGFPGTPTFIVNGRRTEGAIPVERWNELFEAYQRELGN